MAGIKYVDSHPPCIQHGSLSITCIFFSCAPFPSLLVTHPHNLPPFFHFPFLFPCKFVQEFRFMNESHSKNSCHLVAYTTKKMTLLANKTTCEQGNSNQLLLFCRNAFSFCSYWILSWLFCSRHILCLLGIKFIIIC